jgi:hypothetical protein
MSLKDIADLAVALTFVVAAVTFILTVLDKHQRLRKVELQNWQRLVVHEVCKKPVNFEQIKRAYLDAVVQFQEFKIPKKEIQDGALKLALFSLRASGLISLDTQDQYFQKRQSASAEILTESALMQARIQTVYPVLWSRLYDLLERGGEYTVEKAFLKLKVKENLGMDFDQFNYFARNTFQIFVSDDSKLYLLSKRLPTVPKP